MGRSGAQPPGVSQTCAEKPPLPRARCSTQHSTLDSVLAQRLGYRRDVDRDASAPLRLRWGHGLGASAVGFGAVWFFLGAGITAAIVSDLRTLGLGAVPLLAFASILLVPGALLAFGTGGVLIDRARGTGVRSWGLAFVPIIRSRFDLGPSPRADVAEERTRTVVSYRVRLHTAAETVDLAQFPTWLEAEELRLRIATYLGGETSDVGPDELDLAPVPCPSCGSPVSLAAQALRDPTSEVCAHCGHRVTLPAEMAATLAARREAERASDRAEALFRAIAAPPSALERVLARAPSVLLLGLLPFTLIAWSFVFVGYVRDGAAKLAPRLGFDFVDVWGSLPVAFGLSLVAVGIFVAPVLRVRHARALAEVRVTVAAMLVAQPPRHPGGPATCRVCGAPLSVPRGALGARCRHCGEESLVRAPIAWIAAVESHVATARRGIEDAEAKLAEARAAARKKAVVPVVVALVVLAVATLTAEVTLDPGASWSARVAQPKNAEGAPAFCPDLVLGKRTQLSYPVPPYKADTCYYRVPLHRGDVVRVGLEGGGDDVKLAFRHGELPTWNVPFEPVPSGAGGAGSVATFTAPFDGWFRLTLAVPRKAVRTLGVTWDVKGP